MVDLGIISKSSMVVKIPIVGASIDGSSSKPTKGKRNSRLFNNHLKEKTMSLQILPPKRKLMARLMSVGEISDTDIDTFYDIFREILSNNRDGITFSSEYVDQFTVGDIMQVVEAYVQFIMQIQADPN